TLSPTLTLLFPLKGPDAKQDSGLYTPTPLRAQADTCSITVQPWLSESPTVNHKPSYSHLSLPPSLSATLFPLSPSLSLCLQRSSRTFRGSNQGDSISPSSVLPPQGGVLHAPSHLN
ncbi:hypothetical protein F2P56_014521, partial [Juglans regia]